MDEFRLIERQGILSAESVHTLCGPQLRKLRHELQFQLNPYFPRGFRVMQFHLSRFCGPVVDQIRTEESI